jgi:alkanesulfonate monooxygenase SsuD/methylene tetrahydromethanopterin reductase-like flavin-dependent oxidoreductase (luciferase family)
MSRPRVGTVFLPGWAPELLMPVARAAEASGLDDLWFWEDCFNESGPAAAATALAITERITVGVGLMPVPLRQVAITAMEIATLQRLFPGRFVPVIGHGVQRWMAQLGAKPASPLTLLAEYADALRRLLSGETVTTSGDYVHLEGVGLQWPPAAPVRLLVGGEGPKTLALAAARGDGTMLTSMLSEERIREACEIVHGVTAGRPHEIVGHLMVARSDDASAVAATVDRVAALGMTTVLVHSVDEDPDPVAFVEWVGHEVAPRVSA